jgi:hypothetical protein
VTEALTWTEYYEKSMREDPHGISPESREVDEATRSYWDAFWRWDDGTPVKGVIYYNYGAAKKVARKYNFLLSEDNVRNHERLKQANETGERAFSHGVSFRHPAPRDSITQTVIKSL